MTDNIKIIRMDDIYFKSIKHEKCQRKFSNNDNDLYKNNIAGNGNLYLTDN